MALRGTRESIGRRDTVVKQKAEVETPRDETCRRLDPHRTRASDLSTVLVQPGDLILERPGLNCFSWICC